MAEPPTTADLLKQGLITDDDVDAAVDAFMGDPAVTTFIFRDVCRLDLRAAVKAYLFARNNLRNPEASPGLKRAATRKAILLARPERM